MLKKLLVKLKISFCCCCVMLLTAGLIGALYITIFIRKIFFRDFVPHARKDTIDESQELIGSANANINAIKASLEKQAQS